MSLFKCCSSYRQSPGEGIVSPIFTIRKRQIKQSLYPKKEPTNKQRQKVHQYYCVLSFHYLIREDEAQDPGSQLEQEDHCQTDTELWGGKRERDVYYNTVKLICFELIHLGTDSRRSTQTQLLLVTSVYLEKTCGKSKNPNSKSLW